MKDVVSIDDFIKDVTFEPCLLHKVNVKVLKFHGGDKVFVSGVIVWVMGRMCPSGSQGLQRRPCAIWVMILLMANP
jgi:hypothetical protein